MSTGYERVVLPGRSNRDRESRRRADGDRGRGQERAPGRQAVGVRGIAFVVAPVPSFTRKALLEILAGPEPETRLASPVFFGRGTHEASVSYANGAFTLTALVLDDQAAAAIMKQRQAEGRGGFIPGELNTVRKAGAVLLTHERAADFAAAVASLTADAWPWP